MRTYSVILSSSKNSINKCVSDKSIWIRSSLDKAKWLKVKIIRKEQHQLLLSLEKVMDRMTSSLLSTQRIKTNWKWYRMHSKLSNNAVITTCDHRRGHLLKVMVNLPLPLAKTDSSLDSLPILWNHLKSVSAMQFRLKTRNLVVIIRRMTGWRWMRSTKITLECYRVKIWTIIEIIQSVLMICRTWFKLTINSLHLEWTNKSIYTIIMRKQLKTKWMPMKRNNHNL